MDPIMDASKYDIKDYAKEPVQLVQYLYVKNNPVVYIDILGLMPSALEAAYMADHVYDTNSPEPNKKKLIGGWKYERKIVEHGMVMGVYYKQVSKGKVEYALVNKGSSTVGDWVNNFQQPVGWSKDMKASIVEARYFTKLYCEEVTFIGHSKGGAEAAANAVATNRNAILFNPATVFLNSYDLELETYTANMTVYIVEGEALNIVSKGLRSKPIDEVVYLKQPYSTSNGLDIVKNVSNSIKNHAIGTVIKALKGEGYE